ncbi:MAG: AAA family ATPase [Lachnospiraceae bacterium]
MFSQFNNPQVYTVMDKEYADYFGLNEEETRELLGYYGVELNDVVHQMYDGYQIGGLHMYNSWSISNYAKRKTMDNYWVRTSANFFVKEGMKKADRN